MGQPRAFPLKPAQGRRSGLLTPHAEMTMGFFDKIKTFVGEHGCKVEITSMEHQDPAAMRYPAPRSPPRT